MKKRIGNDIQFTWHIYRKDGDTQVPESFTGKEVEVKLISPLQQPVTIEDVSIATGVVTFTFRGKHQVTLGNYVAILQENRGEDGMVTLDVVDAVTLVAHSYMEEDGDEGDVIEAEAVELTSEIEQGFVQQQADWAQTDDTAVDFIKNKPNLDVYCRKDADNTHSDSSDTYVKRVYYEQGALRQLDRLTVGGDSIKFYHSHRGEETKELSLQLDDVEKIKRTATAELDGLMSAEDKGKLNDLPTATELAQELGGKANSADLAEVATSGSYNDLTDKPDLSDFITNSVDNLVNYYLKSETYTKNEVLQLIGAIQQFHYEVYPTLPQTGASNVLYLIGPTGSGSDKYEEYVYANNDWAKIGDTSIDLSGYVTTEALTTALAGYVTSSALSVLLSNYVNKDEIDDVPTANSKNPVTSGGVYDALLGEYVVATATANTGSVTTAKVGIYDVNDVLIVEGEGEVTARILYGKTYKVKCSRVYDYLTPAEQTFTASIPSRQVTMQYTYIERDVVTLDQTISDSAQMLSGDIQGDVIKEIRLHSHLYLGTPATQSGDTEGTELLCQLSDEDSRLYYDGTPAALDGSEGDQWLKLPVFWWKIVGVGEAAADGAHDQYRFMFAFAGEPDPSWNKWQGDRNLVGAKEMKVIDGKGRSVSDGQSTGNFTQAQGNAYAEARNLGCQEVTWEWQWIMCVLFYAWYGNTDSQAVCGVGSGSYDRTLGVTDQLGMTDTTPAQATSLTSARFWGLEAWWNCKYEWLGNVVMENYVLSITDQDTKQTRQVSGFIQCDGTGGWNSRMRIDANGDFVPLAKAGTQTTFYCDWVNSNSGSRVLYRSYSNANASGGVADVSAHNAPSSTYASYGSRLAFNGVITEAESVAAYKAALA